MVAESELERELSTLDSSPTLLYELCSDGGKHNFLKESGFGEEADVVKERGGGVVQQFAVCHGRSRLEDSPGSLDDGGCVPFDQRRDSVALGLPSSRVVLKNASRSALSFFVEIFHDVFSDEAECAEFLKTVQFHSRSSASPGALEHHGSHQSLLSFEMLALFSRQFVLQPANLGHIHPQLPFHRLALFFGGRSVANFP